MNRSFLRSRKSLFAVAAGLLLASPAASALDAAMADGACSVLKAVLPHVKGFKPEGARAQLVMAMADKFEYDGKKLKQLQAEVDAAASARCPKERDAWLALLGSRSLEAALR